MMKEEMKEEIIDTCAQRTQQNDSRRGNRGWGKRGAMKEETRGELCFVCRLLLMRHIWEASETMSHPRAGLSPLSGPSRLSVQDDYVGTCHLATDFSPVIGWNFTVFPPSAAFWTAWLWCREHNWQMFGRIVAYESVFSLHVHTHTKKKKLLHTFRYINLHKAHAHNTLISIIIG